MNAPPWPANPGVGQWFNNWVWTGSQWIAAPTTGMRVVVQVFTASGAYMPSPGLVSLTVECLGGGGGGGSVWAPDATWVMRGGGGGSGGYSRKTLPAALVRGGVPVTIGAGGSSATGGGYTAESGGITSFGALCVANGGRGGYVTNQTGGFGSSGLGATPGIGDIAIAGEGGDSGIWQKVAAYTQVTATGGHGGSIWGGNELGAVTIPGTSNIGDNAHPNTGAGAAGAGVNQLAATSAAGGNGGSGICIVTEYCWGDRDDVAAWSPPVNVNLNVRQKPWGPPPPLPPGTLPPSPGPWPWPRSEDDP